MIDDPMAENSLAGDPITEDSIPIEPIPDEPKLDEPSRRRKRTIGYLQLWGLTVDLSSLPIPIESSVNIRSGEEVIGRAKALCLVSLKGQGLSQYESFAFADGYDVWDHLSVVENDFVLEQTSSETDLLQYSWRYEGMLVMLWALGITKHLGFPAEPTDPAKALERCMTGVLVPTSEIKPMPTLRTPKEILDAADVANSLRAIAASTPLDQPAPADLHRGVVHERSLAFNWLVTTQTAS